ncbi:MAG: SLC13 family permease [Alphaproteobacteria bacterium]
MGLDQVMTSAAIMADAPWQMWVTLAGIGVAIVFFSLERVPMEVTAAGVIIGFLVFFHLFPLPAGQALDANTLLSGFANPALISILCLLIVGQGLYQAGALERPTRLLLYAGRQQPRLTLLVVMVLIAVTSAFLNNTPVAVMFIPIVGALAARVRLLPSKVMMPLTFMCVLGGMTTLIGSSTNLLVAESAVDAGLKPIGFFDFTPLGLILAGIGAIYVLFILPRFLPNNGPLADALVGDGKQFIAEIELSRDHPLVGAEAKKGAFSQLPDIKVRLIQRGATPLNPPFDNLVLKENDILVVVATRKALTALLSSRPDYLKGLIARSGGDGDLVQPDDTVQITNDLVITEAVVAPGSRLVGYSVDYMGFRSVTSCIVLGIQRRSRMYRINLQNIRLEAGDVLLLLGRRKAIKALRGNRDLLLLEWASTDVPNLDKAVVARWIFLGVVAGAATGFLPIVIAALAGALAMVISGCLTVRQAARAVDRRIFMIVGAALAMGSALQHTGGALTLSQALLASLDGHSPSVVLSAFFLLVAVTTNILSNNATAILFTPIAIATGSQLGVDPYPFLLATLFASNASFATPMGYQTNLLVMGPGQYSFLDFVRAGVPLTLIVWLAFSLVAPWYFGLA